MSGIEIERSGAKATLWLNRSERHNAFDDALIAELSAAVASIDAIREGFEVRSLQEYALDRAARA